METESIFQVSINTLCQQEEIEKHIKFLKEKYEDNIFDIKFGIDREEKIAENKLIASAISEAEEAIKISREKLEQARDNVINLEKCWEIS